MGGTALPIDPWSRNDRRHKKNNKKQPQKKTPTPENLLFLRLNIEPSNAPISAPLPCFVWFFSWSPLSLESKLYVCFQSFVFFPLRLPLLSRRMCAREPVRAVVCLRVCLRANVCRLGFPFEHLFDVAVYLFISPPVKALLRRLGLQRIGARVALSAIHQRGALLTAEPVTLAPHSTSA